MVSGPRSLLVESALEGGGDRQAEGFYAVHGRSPARRNLDGLAEGVIARAADGNISRVTVRIAA